MKIHEFDPVIYPRKLWVAVSTDTFSDRFEGVSEWDDTADAIVDCVRDKLRNLGGILVRFESSVLPMVVPVPLSILSSIRKLTGS